MTEQEIDTIESGGENEIVPAISMEVKSGITYPPGSVWMGRGSKCGDEVPKVRKATVRHRHICLICSDTFLAARIDARFCSERCRRHGSRRGLLTRGQKGSDCPN